MNIVTAVAQVILDALYVWAVLLALLVCALVVGGELRARRRSVELDEMFDIWDGFDRAAEEHPSLGESEVR